MKSTISTLFLLLVSCFSCLTANAQRTDTIIQIRPSVVELQPIFSNPHKEKKYYKKHPRRTSDPIKIDTNVVFTDVLIYYYLDSNEQSEKIPFEPICSTSQNDSLLLSQLILKNYKPHSDCIDAHYFGRAYYEITLDEQNNVDTIKIIRKHPCPEELENIQETFHLIKSIHFYEAKQKSFFLSISTEMKNVSTKNSQSFEKGRE